jgi:metallophosphoesterase superfamily enzyme
LITDQHFGVRNDNQSFINLYKNFTTKVVPFIKASNIEQVIALGDTFDKRRSVNFMSLQEAKQMWFSPLDEMGVRLHMLVGNHDIYYKNSLKINAPRELLGEYR